MRITLLRSALATAALVVAAGSARAAESPPAPRRVNINQATAVQLAYLPRVGAKVAARIVEYRKSHGPFTRPEQLMEVKGVGEKFFLTLKPYLALSGPTTLSEKVRAGTRRQGPRQGVASPANAKGRASPAVPSGKGR